MSENVLCVIYFCFFFHDKCNFQNLSSICQYFLPLTKKRKCHKMSFALFLVIIMLWMLKSPPPSLSRSFIFSTLGCVALFGGFLWRGNVQYVFLGVKMKSGAPWVMPGARCLSRFWIMNRYDKWSNILSSSGGIDQSDEWYADMLFFPWIDVTSGCSALSAVLVHRWSGASSLSLLALGYYCYYCPF